MKKYFAIIIVLAVAVGAFFGYKWYETKMQKVGLGLAEQNFPYRDYSEEELTKMYPQIKYADVATRITPEQTYAKFRQALKENNLEIALEQLSKESERYKENADTLTKFSQENKFQELQQHYSEKIEKANMYEAIAQYEYEYYSVQYKQDLIGSINFIKDGNGDWKLDSL